MITKKKIVLIGYMASGKTLIGSLLANELNKKFIDLDVYISSKEAMSIPEIFRKKGEKEFRKLEIEYLNKLLQRKDSFVLAVGGGTPTLDNCMTIINTKAFSIYLNAGVETLYTRLALSNTETRPLLHSINHDLLKEYINMHLSKREKYYTEASITVLVDGLSEKEIVDTIIQKIAYSK